MLVPLLRISRLLWEILNPPLQIKVICGKLKLKLRFCLIYSLRSNTKKNLKFSLGAFLCIPTPNTGQLNPLFHTFPEVFRPIVNGVVARQFTDPIPNFLLIVLAILVNCPLILICPFTPV